MIANLRVLLLRLLAFFRKAQLEHELAEELSSHLEMLFEENSRKGMAPEEAWRAARRSLGQVEQIREVYRDQRGLPLLETLVQDIRYGLRMVRKYPGITSVGAATLALGIGATTMMFSVVVAALVRPLPYVHPDRLVVLSETNPLKHWTNETAAPANFADWRNMNTAFTDIAGYVRHNVFVTGHGEPRRLRSLAVSGNLFDVLGVPPLLGRTLTMDETFEGKSRVAILSYGLWREEFGGDQAIVGRNISLTGKNYEVVGVMPEVFFFPDHDIQIYIPFGFKPTELLETRRPHYMSVVARLRVGASLDRARMEMSGIASRLERMYPDTNTQMGVRVDNFHTMLAKDIKPELLMLFAAVCVLFLIVCSNVANLQLGRAAARVRELDIRQALGAGRRRLVRQLLTESLILSTLGGALGLALAISGRSILMHLAPEAIPRYAELRLDAWIILFAIAVTLFAPVLFGVAPALAGTRPDTLRVRNDTALKKRQSMQNLLVTLQVALSLMLVTGAVLLVRSLIRLERTPPGFDPSHAISFSLTLPEVRYPREEQIVSTVEEIERRLLADPQLDRVGTTLALPLRGFAWSGDATVEGRPAGEYERELRHNSVTPGYFSAIGTALLRGRIFDKFDTAKSPAVTIVNETLEKAYFRGESAVGKRIKFGRPQDNDSWVTIVGVVADAKQDGIDKFVQPEEFTPFEQRSNDALTMVVRGRVPVDHLVALARQTVWSIDRDLALTDTTSLPRLLRESTGDQRFRTSLLSIYAAIALFLALLGIYGVLSYSVSRRLHEMGIRRALGAPHRRLYWTVVRDGMQPVLLGAALGLAGAYVASRLITSLLYGVAPTDPDSYALTTVTLLAASLFACSIPALKAISVDPMVVLRYE